MYLFFDTETTGLAYKAKQLTPEDPNYPRIMQIAALLLDSKFNPIAQYSTLVKLEPHVQVDPKAQEAHGITKEDCEKYGVPAEIALMMFQSFAKNAQHFCGHNVEFDCDMITAEERALFAKQGIIPVGYSKICTMELMTPICKLPHARWKNQYKWPKLNEAYKHVFGREFEDAHDALADVRASIDLYKWILNLAKPPVVSTT